MLLHKQYIQAVIDGIKRPESRERAIRHLPKAVKFIAKSFVTRQILICKWDYLEVPFSECSYDRLVEATDDGPSIRIGRFIGYVYKRTLTSTILQSLNTKKERLRKLNGKIG